METEYIDILDERGKKTGESKPRSEAHEKGLWHRSAHVWLLNEKGEILLQRRDKSVKNHPDMWDISAAGHVVAGDESLHSALKETEEELGLKLNQKQLMFIGEVTQKSVSRGGAYINNEFNDVYIAKTDSSIQITEEPREVSRVLWLPWKEFEIWIKEDRKDVVSHPAEYHLLFNYLNKNGY